MIIYRRLSSVRAISFDLDDTLYDNRPVILAAEQGQLEYMHQRYPQTLSVGADAWKQAKLDAIRHNPSLADDVAAWRKAALSIYLTHASVPAAWRAQACEDIFNEFVRLRSDFRVSAEVVSLMRMLSERVPLVAITNGNVDIERIGLRPYFQACHYANLTLGAKPQTGLFDVAAQQLNIPTGNILHVGDSLTNDVYGAIRSGYQAAFYAHGKPTDMRANRPRVLPHVYLRQLSDLLCLV